MTTTNRTPTTTIFTLPPELRLLIWEYYMTDIPIPPPLKWKPDNLKKSRHTTIKVTRLCLVPYQQPPLLRVSDEIRAEALEAYCKPFQQYRGELVHKIKGLKRPGQRRNQAAKPALVARLAELDGVLKKVDREMKRGRR